MELSRPELRTLPVTGVDGLAEVGQKLVHQRILAATILQQSTGGPAIEWNQHETLEQALDCDEESLVS